MYIEGLTAIGGVSGRTHSAGHPLVPINDPTSPGSASTALPQLPSPPLDPDAYRTASLCHHAAENVSQVVQAAAMEVIETINWLIPAWECIIARCIHAMLIDSYFTEQYTPRPEEALSHAAMSEVLRTYISTDMDRVIERLYRHMQEVSDLTSGGFLGGLLSGGTYVYPKTIRIIAKTMSSYFKLARISSSISVSPGGDWHSPRDLPPYSTTEAGGTIVGQVTHGTKSMEGKVYAWMNTHVRPVYKYGESDLKKSVSELVRYLKTTCDADEGIIKAACECLLRDSPQGASSVATSLPSNFGPLSHITIVNGLSAYQRLVKALIPHSAWQW